MSGAPARHGQRLRTGAAALAALAALAFTAWVLHVTGASPWLFAALAVVVAAGFAALVAVAYGLGWAAEAALLRSGETVDTDR